MKNIWDFLEDISDNKDANVEYFSEPIIKNLKRASEINNDDRYIKMRKINPMIDEEFYFPLVDHKKKFYLQAKFAENFTEDTEIINVNYYPYLPRYDSFTIKELKSYFSWRTKYRNGIVVNTCLPYIIIYLSEIVNQIGVVDVNDGFDIIVRLKNDYVEYRSVIENIQFQYAVYYNLEIETTDEFNIKLSNIISTIENRSFSATLDEFEMFSNYKISKSRFIQSDFGYLVSKSLEYVFNELEDFYKKNRRIPLLRKLFGKAVPSPWIPFSTTNFYIETPHENCEIIVNLHEKYVCKDGKWHSFSYNYQNVNIKLISEILKTTEHYVRLLSGYPHKLKKNVTSDILDELLQKSITKFFTDNNFIDIIKAKKLKKAVDTDENTEPIVVNIDSSKFDSIRKTSEILKEKLIVDEEDNEIYNATLEITNEAPKNEDNSDLTGFDLFISQITSIEKEILICLLNNTDYSDILLKNNIMESVIIESINEKAYESISDNLIDTFSNTIYEDYVDELTEVL